MELHKPVHDLSVSEIERNAKQAAVDAVEERWRRQDRLRKREALRKALRSFFAVVLLLLIAAGAVFWFTHKSEMTQLAEKACAAVVSDDHPAQGESPLVPAPSLETKPNKVVERVRDVVTAKSDPSVAFRERYLRLTTVFSKKVTGFWKSVPASIRPKNASPGTVYHALVPRRPDGYDIYEMTTSDGGLTYDLMSPIADSVRVKSSDFSAACKASGYLIEHDGRVYMAGKAGEAEAAAIQKRLKTVHE